jgi:hypothetical protein
MTTHYTPGPWEADHCSERRIKDDPGHWQIDGPTPMGLNNTMPYTVADTSNRNYCISPEEDAANARLIAAAPTMLKALKAIEEALRKDSRQKDIIGDEVEYHLDGQTLGWAITTARKVIGIAES